MINFRCRVAAPLAIALLHLVTATGAARSRATASPVLQAQSNNCRQTTTQLDIHAQPDLNASVVGNVRRGDRVLLSGPPSTEWIPIAIPQEGYILSRYLEACSGLTPRTEDPAALGLDNIVVGCGQVANLGTDPDSNSPQTLPLYSSLGNASEAPFDAIAPQGILALGPSIQRNGRYWVSLLAYPPANPAQAAASPTGVAWAAESGPNVPGDLSRDATNNLVYPNGRAYLDLAIIRRPCLDVFGPAIEEDQPLPAQLPFGYQVP